jgi:hypothetical protein
MLRLIRIADLPGNVPIRAARTTLDYSEVGGRRYLLPLDAENDLGIQALQTHNHFRSLNYRKFDAGSQNGFEDK